MAPRVTVLMSVHNGEKYLGPSIESILHQTFTDFEFLIVDDGSTDRTSEILQAYSRTDSRIRLLHNPQNLGLTKSLNMGQKRVRGEFIARQDADDTSFARRLERQVAILEDSTHIALVGSRVAHIDTFGRVSPATKHTMTPILIAWRLLFRNEFYGHSSVMFRTSIFESLGGYNEAYLYAQDYELWSRMQVEAGLTKASDTLSAIRNHPSRISNRHRVQQKAFALQVVNHNLARIFSETCPDTIVSDVHHFFEYQFGLIRDPISLNHVLKTAYAQYVERRLLHESKALLIQRDMAEQYSHWAISAAYQRHHTLKMLIRSGKDWNNSAFSVGCLKSILTRFQMRLFKTIYP